MGTEITTEAFEKMKADLAAAEAEKVSLTAAKGRSDAEAAKRRKDRNTLQDQFDTLKGEKESYDGYFDEIGHIINPDGDKEKTRDILNAMLMEKTGAKEGTNYLAEISKKNQLLNQKEQENVKLRAKSDEFDQFKALSIKNTVSSRIKDVGIKNNISSDYLEHFATIASTRIKDIDLNNGEILCTYGDNELVKLDDAVERISKEKDCSIFLNADDKGLGANRGSAIKISGKFDKHKYRDEKSGYRAKMANEKLG